MDLYAGPRSTRIWMLDPNSRQSLTLLARIGYNCGLDRVVRSSSSFVMPTHFGVHLRTTLPRSRLIQVCYSTPGELAIANQ